MTTAADQTYLFDFYTDTPTRTMKFSIWMGRVEPSSIHNFVEKTTFENLCRTGCPNYGNKWSCPPFAPNYRDFAEGYQYLYVFYMRFDLNQYSHVKNDSLKIRAAHNVLKSRSERFLRSLAPKYGAYISGSCRLCKPCKCKLGEPCAHPEQMSYSFEALGINVSSLVEHCFQSNLLWYKRGSLPSYTSFVCGLLSNALISVEELHKEFLSIVK